MEGQSIDLVYTTPGRCELDKPRLFLGSRILRFMHWRSDLKRSVPCLRDYGQVCEPCGVQTEFAFLAAVLIEARAPSRLSGREAWEALSESERAERRATLAADPFYSGRSPEWIESACIGRLTSPTSTAHAPTFALGRAIVQCLPVLSLRGFDLDSLAGVCVRIGHNRARHVVLHRQTAPVESPPTFDVEPVFRARYGVRVDPPPQEDEPAILKFRKLA